MRLARASSVPMDKLVEKPDDDAATKATKTARRAKFTAKGLPADFATNLATDRGAIDSAKTIEDGADSEGVKNTALTGTAAIIQRAYDTKKRGHTGLSFFRLPRCACRSVAP